MAKFIPMALSIEQAAAAKHACEAMSRSIRGQADIPDEAAKVFEETAAEITDSVRDVVGEESRNRLAGLMLLGGMVDGGKQS